MRVRHTYNVNRQKIVYIRTSRPIYNSKGKVVSRVTSSIPMLQNFTDTKVEYRNVPVVGIAKTVFFILLMYAFCSALMGRESTVSFTTFFTSLKYAPSLPMADIFKFVQSLRISTTGLPVVTQFLVKQFNNFVMPLISLATYLTLCIVQLLTFVGWFLSWIFTGVYTV